MSANWPTARWRSASPSPGGCINIQRSRRFVGSSLPLRSIACSMSGLIAGNMRSCCEKTSAFPAPSCPLNPIPTYLPSYPAGRRPMPNGMCSTSPCRTLRETPVSTSWRPISSARLKSRPIGRMRSSQSATRSPGRSRCNAGGSIRFCRNYGRSMDFPAHS